MATSVLCSVGEAVGLSRRTRRPASWGGWTLPRPAFISRLRRRVGRRADEAAQQQRRSADRLARSAQLPGEPVYHASTAELWRAGSVHGRR